MATPALPALAQTVAPAEGVILTATQVVKTHKAVNLSLLKLGPLMATILGGIFTVITIVSAAAIVVVVVVASNPLPPMPFKDFGATFKQVDIPIYVLGNDRDPRGNTLSIISVTRPKHGRARIIPALGNNPSYIVYRSNQFFSGNDTFSYTIQNEQQKTAEAEVVVTVENRPPTAVDITYDDVKKNVPYTADIFAYVDVNGNKINDVDNDTLTIVDVSAPSSGSIQINGRLLVYTPNNNFKGTDQVTYTIADDDNAQATGTITFIVKNMAPVAKMDLFTFRKNTRPTLDVLANDFDPNGDDITITGVFGSAYGVATLTPDSKNITFLAGPQQYQDSFQYTISDGQDSSSSFGIVSFYNMPPEVSAASITVSKNSAVNPVTVTFSDPDELDTVTLLVDTSASSGSVESTPTETIVEKNYFNQLFLQIPYYSYAISYTPRTGFLGSDSFVIIADDNQFQDNSVATTTVTVTVVNDAPVAVDDSVQCRKNINCEFDVLSNDSDPNGDSVQLPSNGAFQTVTSTNGGSLTILPNGQIRYRAAQDFVGTDTFQYRVVDVQDAGFESFAKNSNYATVSITVSNDAPVAAADSASVFKSQTVVIDVLVNDSDANGDALIVTDVTTSSSGVTPSIIVQNGKTVISYTALNSVYTDSFTYRVKDNSNDYSNYAQVTVSVANRAPVATDDQFSTIWNNANRQNSITLNVLSNDSDADSGDTAKLTISRVVGAPVGLNNRGTFFTYQPAQDLVGTVTFTYYATDGFDESNAATVTIQVTNTAPVAKAASASTHFKLSTTVDVLADCTDIESDVITLTRLVSSPSVGTASIQTVNGKVVVSYTPPTNPFFQGSVNFDYEITDGKLTAQGTVTVGITNSAPQAAADTYSVHWRQGSTLSFDVTSNDVDTNTNDIPLNLASTIDLGTGFVAGSAVADTTNRVIVYTVPAASSYPQGWNRVNTFTYSVNDGLDASTATVTVTHTNTNKPSGLSYTSTIHWTVQKAGIQLPALTSSTDADGDSLTLRSATGTGAAHVTVNSQQGTVTYARTSPVKGTDTFDVSYDDGLDSALISYTVTTYNNRPVARNIAATIPYSLRASGIQIDLTPTDLDPEDSANLSVSNPIAAGTQGSGSVRSLTGNVLSYSFPAGFTGSDILTYTVSDGFETSAPATINITMTPPDLSSVAYTYPWTQALAGVTLDLFADLPTTPPADAVIQTISGATLGTTSDAQNGKVSYVWTKSIANLGTDSFTAYWTSAATAASGFISVSITITNQKPSCNINSISGPWRTYFDNAQSINALSTVTVESGETASAQTIITPATLGTSTLSGNSVSYKLNNPGVTPDSLTVRVSDGLETCDVQIRLSFTNTAPSAPVQSFSPHWRSTLNTANPSYQIDVAAAVTDTNLDPISITSVTASAPTFGTFSLVSGNTYGFAADVAILRNNLRKPSTFTYTASDRVSTSSNTLTITPTNSAPVANDDGSVSNRLSIPSSTRLTGGHTINVYANDVENDVADRPFVSISLPSTTSTGGASLSVVGTTVVYTAPANTGASFQDSFTYTLSDGIESSTATVYVVVVNTPPVASPSTETMKWNLTPGRTINLNTLCSDSDALTFTYTQPPSKKGDITTTGTPGVIVYTPRGSSIVESDYVNNVASDSITYRCTDTAGNVATNTISIQIQNTAPTGNNISVVRPKNRNDIGTSFSVNLVTAGVFTDADGDSISFVSQNYVSAVSSRRGTVTVSGTILTYTINTAVTGTETWQFVLTDGNRQVTRQISVQFTNVAPTCNSVNLGTFFRTGFTISNMLSSIGAADANNDILSISSVTLTTANAGSVTLNSNTNIAFVGAKLNGAISVNVVITDGESTTNCPVSFNYLNRSPTGLPLTKQYLRVPGSVPTYTYSVITEASITDPDADGIIVTGAYGTGCGQSTVSFTANSVIFRPAFNVNIASCVITYTFNDDATPLAAGAQTITISVIDSPPVANDDSYTFNQGPSSWAVAFSDLLANDSDANGDPLSITSANIVNCVGCTIVGTTISVPFDPNSCNTFRFQYRATAFGTDSNLATVTIKPVNCKCRTPLDIVYVLDGSGSISSTNWGNMKSFINGINGQLTLSESMVRVAVLQYSEVTSVTSPFGYPYQTSRTSATTATNNLRQYASWTATREGLKKGHQYLSNNRRTNVPAVIVLITDGDANRPCVGTDGWENKQCQDVIDYETDDGDYTRCQYSPSASGCSNAHAISTFPTYANRVRTCDQCNFSSNRCFPCADPVPLASTIKSSGIKIVALGVGDAISQAGKDAIAQISSAGVYTSAPWNDLSNAIAMIVDSSCDTTA